ncbi:MAG TPA: PaaI family thioesterase [Clostridia bacterium]|nr:PaaI family thioesterase [Clostridia bacterium]
MQEDRVYSKEEMKKLNEKLKEAPLWKMIDMRIASLKWGRSEMTMSIKDTYLNVMGTCHGGVIAAFADTVMGSALYSTGAAASATIEMNINFLEPVMAGQVLTGRGEVLRKGKTTAVIRADLFVGETMVAAARGTYSVLEPNKQK